MCRLLAVKSQKPFSIADHLTSFSLIAKNSKEYQGHGWGCSFLDENGRWRHYKNIKPVWEDDLTVFGNTNHLIAHARSAFKDTGITVENNMPFYDETYSFVFNGELQGVSLNEAGRIGAEKIFNFIKRFDKGDIFTALLKAVPIIYSHAKYVRAMNIIISDGSRIYVSSQFCEDYKYFTMRYMHTDTVVIVCSEAYPKPFKTGSWSSIENGTFRVF